MDEYREKEPRRKYYKNKNKSIYELWQRKLMKM